jgi:hypothetical protein
MPFPYQVGLVAEFFEPFGHCRSVCRYGAVLARFEGIAVHPRSDGVIPGEEGRSGRGATVLGIVSVKNDAVVGEGVQVGGGDLIRAMETDIVAALDCRNSVSLFMLSIVHCYKFHKSSFIQPILSYLVEIKTSFLWTF